MANEDRDLLTVLRAELEFLEKGGYRHSPSAPWRPQFIFEDSPTCKNYGNKQELLPCSECALMRFVPEDCRGERIPCRHIPLTVEGYTIDTFYRLGTQEELEAGVVGWLRKTIQRVEGEGAQQEEESRAAKPGDAAAVARG
jgi:hypothetical protein